MKGGPALRPGSGKWLQCFRRAKGTASTMARTEPHIESAWLTRIRGNSSENLKGEPKEVGSVQWGVGDEEGRLGR